MAQGRRGLDPQLEMAADAVVSAVPDVAVAWLLAAVAAAAAAAAAFELFLDFLIGTLIILRC